MSWSTQKYLILALLFSHGLAMVAGYLVGRGHRARLYSGAEDTEFRLSEKDTLDLERMVWTTPSVAVVQRDTVRVQTECVEVPSSLVDRPPAEPSAGAGAAGPADSAADSARAGVDVGVTAPGWEVPPSRPERLPFQVQAQLLGSSYRFLLLPVNEKGAPLVRVGRSETTVSAFLARGGRSITFRYPHPRPAWRISAGLESVFMVDRLGSFATATVRYKRWALSAGYGATWRPLQPAVMGPLVELQVRLFSFTL